MILGYEAIDATGGAVADTIEAGSVREATEQLRSRGLYLTSIAEQKETAKRPAVSSQPAAQIRLPVKTLALFTRQMAMMLNAGSAVVPAVSAIQRHMAKPKQAAMLGQIVADLEEGVTLTDAMRRHPRTFDAVYCAIVAAGEASGNLPPMFERLALIVSKQRAMRNKVIGSLTYPALLIVMSFKILLVMLLFVLPRFHQMFIELDVEAPASTKALLATGAFLRSSWHLLMLGMAVVAAGIVFASRGGRGKRWLGNIQLSIPIIGIVRTRLIQGQIFRTMGTLISSRVGLLETLALVRETTGNRRFQKLFDRLEEVVTSGGQMSTAFEESGLIEPYICQAVRTGEDCGSLGDAMTYCADVLDESNTELVDAMTRLIEPIILIGLGVVVGGVAISLFLPLFDMTSAMQ